MTFKKLILSVTLFSIILISGCAPHIKPTDVCNFDLPVSQLHSNSSRLSCLREFSLRHS